MDSGQTWVRMEKADTIGAGAGARRAGRTIRGRGGGSAEQFPR